MMPIQKAFDAFSPTVKGGIAGATVVGALFGVEIGLQIPAEGIGWLWCTLIPAGAFFLCGCFLGMMDLRSKRIAAGKAKPISIWVVFAIFGVILALGFGACVAYMRRP